MNCKPGDRAVIVRNVSRDPCFDSMLGAVVTVDSIYARTLLFGPAWSYNGGDLLTCRRCGARRWVALLDADLMPLPPEQHVREHDERNETPNDIVTNASSWHASL